MMSQLLILPHAIAQIRKLLRATIPGIDGTPIVPPNYNDKATMLFYLVTKIIPFENGNKRMAVML